MKFSATALIASAAVVSALSLPNIGAALKKRTLPGSSTNKTLITLLENAPTGRLRTELITNDDDYSYDFQNPPTEAYISTGKGGKIVVANRYTMPGLIGTGSSMSVGFLGPCALNTPHTHPRGTEMNIIVQGNLVTSFIQENGARVVHHNGSLYDLAVFPQGALHMEYNPNCTPTVFVAAFNNEDAATLQAADSFFELDTNVIKAALGSQTGKVIIAGEDLEAVKPVIPSNVAIGVEECLSRCGIMKRSVDPKVKRAVEEVAAELAAKRK